MLVYYLSSYIIHVFKDQVLDMNTVDFGGHSILLYTLTSSVVRFMLTSFKSLYIDIYLMDVVCSVCCTLAC